MATTTTTIMGTIGSLPTPLQAAGRQFRGADFKSRRNAVIRRVFADEGHSVYYQRKSTVCKKVEKEMTKAAKKERKERKQLLLDARDKLVATCAATAAVEADVGILAAAEQESAEILEPEVSDRDSLRVEALLLKVLDELESVRSEVKEAKKMAKEAKEMAMDESSSSSSSSSDGGMGMTMARDRARQMKARTMGMPSGPSKTEAPATSEAMTATAVATKSKSDDATAAMLGGGMPLPSASAAILGAMREVDSRPLSIGFVFPQEMSIPVSIDVQEQAAVAAASIAGATSISVASEVTGYIEVCMGGSCRKAGAGQVLASMETAAMNTENVIAYSCKCLGKCKQGPTVRTLTSADESKEDRELILQVTPQEAELIVMQAAASAAQKAAGYLGSAGRQTEVVV